MAAHPKRRALLSPDYITDGNVIQDQEHFDLLGEYDNHLDTLNKFGLLPIGPQAPQVPPVQEASQVTDAFVFFIDRIRGTECAARRIYTLSLSSF